VPLLSTDVTPTLSNTQIPTRNQERMAAADEAELIQQARQGHHGAYRVLVERHMRKAYNLAYSFVNDHAGAEDITQDAFIRAYHALPSFRGEAGFGTWLYRIVTNLSLNTLKQRRALSDREVTMESLPSPHDGTEEFARRGEIKAHVERALHELPTLQRAVVILRHFDGLSTRQVSAILGCSEGTVKTHLFRGLKKLREKLAYLKTEL
jgi:RNA polymerase sigma-70 factor (ECF subfamily)